jgi:hypothetical protein
MKTSKINYKDFWKSCRAFHPDESEDGLKMPRSQGYELSRLEILRYRLFFGQGITGSGVKLYTTGAIACEETGVLGDIRLFAISFSRAATSLSCMAVE